MRLLHCSDFCNVLFRNLLECLFSLKLHWNGLIKFLLTINFNCICFCCCFWSDSLVLSNISCYNFSKSGFFLDNTFLNFYFLRSLDQEWLLCLKFSLHNTDWTFCLDETVVTIGITVFKVFDFLSFSSKKIFECWDQLEVGCWGHIVMTLELSLEFTSSFLSVGVESLHHCDTLLSCSSIHFNLTQETNSDWLKGILWPLWEPVNSSTID